MTDKSTAGRDGEAGSTGFARVSLEAPRIDAATGLLSKEAFFDEAAAYLRHSGARDVSIVCFDVDHFKLFNDLHGLDCGDELLRYLGRALALRFSPDEAQPLARLAADTFALCATGIRPECVERILVDISSECPNGIDAIVRAGVYRIEDPASPVSIMCDRAVIALRTVKGSYFDRVALYDPGMREALVLEREVVAGIESALREDRIELFLQPKCNIRTGKIVGAEALARWRHPERGIVAPGEFIPLIERNGLVRSLDLRVWEKTAAWIRGLIDEGVQPVPVSVNVSRADIYLVDVAAELHALVERYGIDPSLIEVEITESAYSERPDRIVAAFDALAERGFTVLMDDFGSGYSSLNMLKDINVDVLKIDMRFLDRDDRRSKDIMESVIRMARWLDLPVIAEGVETREQVNFLLDVGCSYAQGYYYARPMEAAAFEALLTDGSKVQHEQCALQDARRPILDFRDLLHENTISDRMLSSIIGSVALYSYADGDLRLIRGNEAYRRLIATLGEGVNGAEEGGSLLPFVHDEDRDALVAAAEETVRSCPDDGVEVVVRRMGTNGCHWHKMRLFHLNTTNGSATVYGSVTDVTERMEYMEALRKSEQRFEMTLEASGTVVFELDIPTRTARYSEFLQQAFGLAETVANAPEGFIEQGTVAEESIEDFRAIYRDLYAGAPRTSAVVRAIMGDGSRAWNRVTLLAMPNETGAPVKAVGLVENVTRETEMDLLLKRLGRFEQD
ncbi:GGDEF domain-containing phosphodiesterase [Eggerthella lenta]|uniref:GGDEF domain-containing phosphodiesterase n=1 Tax=Eggerthella lenta TaxID=84112 RepID=UPI001C2BDDF7|nr:GGDEF domain-containing phosphodiesterase [Eggerthella lenta]MBU9893305.1 GGDEF domain-containing phosphodiesterase [Eggerthella lenta]MBV4057729.1 GGDEF domain-containing phosphodiesterase [Eggerthella lenta]MBV4105211.1 GGDEF domain-containing phosphodiesterase [Eggerthella lenta]MBV4128619.1 GGDEF domain-containing phosphodiesterase [Eggerthella lenta]MBV4142767.1 GGDEF domain-containing phosphodiesterase [Eggerthella lenta]